MAPPYLKVRLAVVMMQRIGPARVPGPVTKTGRRGLHLSVLYLVEGLEPPQLVLRS